MEILGRSLASLPPDISHALDTLAEGIAQSTPFGLDQAIDTFSAENIGQMDLPWDGPTMPVIGGQAAFLSPTDFISQTKSMSESNPIFEEIQTQLQDSKFNQNAALTSCLNNLFGGNGILDNLIGKDGVLAEALGGVAFPPVGTDPAQKQGIAIGGERGIVISDGRIGDSTTAKGIGKGIQDPVEAVGLATPGAKPSDPIGDRGIILVGGKSLGDPVASQDLATPGAKPSDPIGDRGIILVGGKSLGDPAASQHLATPGLLPTLDDSMNKLKNLDPYTSEGRQTLSVFQQQVGVLQGMEGTVKSQAALAQQMGTSLRGKILG